MATKNAGDWAAMLDQLGAALDQANSELHRHEQALSSPLLSSDLSDERHISWQRALERFGERLQDFQLQVNQAERKSAAAEQALAEREDELRQFAERLRTIHGNLSLVPAPPIQS